MNKFVIFTLVSGVIFSGCTIKREIKPVSEILDEKKYA